MENRPITEIKTRFKENQLTAHEIALLRNDPRKGVQQIIKAYEKKKLKEKELEILQEKMFTYERNSYANGKTYVAGVDEAGRGPLAGPVVAAAVILPTDFKLLGLNDSKQLSEPKREEFFEYIIEHAISYGISIVQNDVIDNINIYEATKLAMREAIAQLNPQADHVLIDAVPLEGLTCSSESIVKGDAKSVSIAAASILAKVTRDRLMREIHVEYPMYDFASNMGYGTKLHIDRLREYGISPYHRTSFAPIKDNLK
ncbi:ribonuclease HII [Ornithinibacillus halotolerans]|uniref:Ribonuclease HII n=1 Tax=Ornithinibacillus halotolerans TaxID=1274357 RepID=A0A916SBC2_9BACI|nr:ribonuclease HII [Ornithinibacillus halotolerans]GGA92213.1 ribonuclease HII [Ornithinibacillus halotolerans]